MKYDKSLISPKAAGSHTVPMSDRVRELDDEQLAEALRWHRRQSELARSSGLKAGHLHIVRYLEKEDERRVLERLGVYTC